MGLLPLTSNKDAKAFKFHRIVNVVDHAHYCTSKSPWRVARTQHVSLLHLPIGVSSPINFDTWKHEASTEDTRYKNRKKPTTTFSFLPRTIGESHYLATGDALLTSIRTETEAEYIEEQQEFDFGALIGHDKEAQEMRTVVYDKTFAVEHCDNEEELIDVYVSTVLLHKLKHGPIQVDKLLRSCSTGCLRGKRCSSLQEAALLINTTLKITFKSDFHKIVWSWRTSLIATAQRILCTLELLSRSSKSR